MFRRARSVEKDWEYYTNLIEKKSRSYSTSGCNWCCGIGERRLLSWEKALNDAQAFLEKCSTDKIDGDKYNDRMKYLKIQIGLYAHATDYFYDDTDGEYEYERRRNGT